MNWLINRAIFGIILACFSDVTDFGWHLLMLCFIVAVERIVPDILQNKTKRKLPPLSIHKYIFRWLSHENHVWTTRHKQRGNVTSKHSNVFMFREHTLNNQSKSKTKKNLNVQTARSIAQNIICKHRHSGWFRYSDRQFIVLVAQKQNLISMNGQPDKKWGEIIAWCRNVFRKNSKSSLLHSA